MSNNHRDNVCTSTIYLMRHGDSRPDHIKRYIGWTDLPLNANGHGQALRWQQELAGVPFRRIFCSDLSRSFETARIIAAGRDVPVRAHSQLREINLGAWDGLSVDDVCCSYPGEYAKRGAELASYRTPGGESFADLASRVLPLFKEIVRSMSGNVLIVGHAGVNQVILCHILGMPLENLFRLRQDYGCLNLIDRRKDGMGLRRMNMDSLACSTHPS